VGAGGGGDHTNRQATYDTPQHFGLHGFATVSYTSVGPDGRLHARRFARRGYALPSRRVELYRRASCRGACCHRQAARSLPAASCRGRLGRAAAAFASMAAAPASRAPVGRPLPPRHVRPSPPRRNLPAALAQRAHSSAAADAPAAAHGAGGDRAAARRSTRPTHRLFPAQWGPIVGAVPAEKHPTRRAAAGGSTRSEHRVQHLCGCGRLSVC